MFDLLKEAYLIPKRFHGKAGENPILLTDADGKLLADKKNLVSKHEYKKFQEIYHAHDAAPRSKLYLADGYDLVRYYTSDMNIKEKHENKERGILLLYALPDTKKLHLSEAQAYDVIWTTFFIKSSRKLTLPLFFTVRKTGSRSGKTFDELGVLLPIKQFESKMLRHIGVIGRTRAVLSRRNDPNRRSRQFGFIIPRCTKTCPCEYSQRLQKGM